MYRGCLKRRVFNVHIVRFSSNTDTDVMSFTVEYIVAVVINDASDFFRQHKLVYL